MKVGDQVFTASAGDFLRVPAGASHAWRCIGKTPGKILLTYVPGGIRGFFEEIRSIFLAPEMDVPFIKLSASYRMLTKLAPPFPIVMGV